MSYTLTPDFEHEVGSPEPSGSQGSLAMPQTPHADDLDLADDWFAGIEIEEEPSPARVVRRDVAQVPSALASAKEFTEGEELEIAAKAAAERRDGARAPASWGGVVSSSQPQAGSSTAHSEDRIERLSADSLSVPVYAYGHLTVVPVSTRDEFRAVTDFLHARMKAVEDKAVIVTPKRMHVNVAPEVAKRLAYGGVVIVNGDDDDPVRGAQRFIKDFAARRIQTLKNFQVFMRQA